MKAQHQKTLLNADSPMNVFFTDVTEFPPHWHEAVEVVYVPEGSLRVGVNGTVYTMEPGDILLITGGDVHYFVPETNRVNRLILHFEMSYFETAFPEARNKRFAGVLLTEKESVVSAGQNFAPVHKSLVEQITGIIREYNDQRDAYKIAMRARLFDILVILLREIPMQAYSSQERNRDMNRLGRLENVFRYVEENYTAEISLRKISAVANFSEYYFTRFFKEATGMTFGRYLNNYRVEKAVELLRNEDDTITEVVFKSGFGSIKTFNRVFKQIKGCSPTTYKKTIFEA
ncbi:MAG TPA: AraC family transcriptional regulator [Clostridia bacterium]|nr:AraC family transcriptional regulator [Clostridia bacterium]